MPPQPNENQALLSSNGGKTTPESSIPNQQLGVNTYDGRHLLRRRRRCVFATFWALFVISIVLCIAVVFVAESHKKSTYDALNAVHSSPALTRGCQATVLLLRHCEKFGPSIRDPVHNQHCSYLGLERAKFISKKLFGKRWPIPDSLYALSPERPRHLNFREIETLLPLSEKAGVGINHNYTNEQRTVLADEVFDKLRSGALCGKVVAISWDQAALPALARALGCSPNEGCPTRYSDDTFDDVWQLKYVYGPPILYPAKEEEKGAVRRGLARVKDMWFVYGGVTHMNFDPLQFSMKNGIYPLEGTPLDGPAI